MKIEKALIIRTGVTENYTPGEELINDIFYDMDTKEYKGAKVLANKDAQYHNWLDGIEYINPLYFEDAELGVISKVRANEALEITQSTFSLLDRIQTYYQIRGLVVINNKKIKEFLKRCLTEFDRFAQYKEIESETIINE